MIDELRCTECNDHLSQNSDILVCRGCGKSFPVLDDIPVFGSESDIAKWTAYHTDLKNARRVASGGYISDVPTPANSFYSRFIPEDAHRVLDCGGGGMAARRLTGQPVILMPRFM